MGESEVHSFDVRFVGLHLREDAGLALRVALPSDMTVTVPP